MMKKLSIPPQARYIVRLCFSLKEKGPRMLMQKTPIPAFKGKIQNVGFGNLTREVPVRLAVVPDSRDAGQACSDVSDLDLSAIDFRNVRSRTISVAGGDTAMTFDGNNEVEIETRLSLQGKGDYRVYLKVGNIEFANGKTDGTDSCLGGPAVFLGKVHYDESLKISGLSPRAIPDFAPATKTKNAPFVQRVRHNAVVRDGEKSYRANGAGIGAGMGAGMR